MRPVFGVLPIDAVVVSPRLKVLGWIGYRSECPPAANGSRQTREIMACRSWADVIRATGWSRRDLMRNGDETGNAAEIATALKEPGVVFWRPVNDYRADWTRDAR